MNSLLTANLSCLEQGIQFLKGIASPDYNRACVEVFGSTIGGHIRHNVDHYIAFVEGFNSGKIDYDAREREAAIEQDPDTAIACMEKLKSSLQALEDADLNGRLRICMDDGGDSSWSETSLRRELQFLLSHTIHHYALIVSIATRYGITEFPAGFGIAPSTLHYQAGQGA